MARAAGAGGSIGLVAAGLVAAALIAGGCSSPSNGANGGSTGADASSADAASDATEIDAGIGWGDLYRDFFGAPPPGPGCAGTGQCHGAADQPGAQASGYVCGTSKDECYRGITGAHLVNTTTPAQSGLIGIIRHRDANGTTVGIMPKEPSSYVFPDAGVARIEAWMAAGAQND